MRLPSPTTDVFPSGFAISHNISPEGKENTKPQQQHKRIDYLDALIMGMFKDTDGKSIDLYDNSKDLPSNVEADTHNVTQFECKHYHNEDKQFPVVPPSASASTIRIGLKKSVLDMNVSSQIMIHSSPFNALQKTS